jgi:hypothetical protein
VTFSYMSGTIHPYYTVALAPAIAAVVAIGGRVLWLYRAALWARLVLAAMTVGTAVWGWELLGRSGWLPGLRWATLVLGAAFGLALLLPPARARRLAVVALVAATLAAGAGSAAFGAATATVAHSGSIPSSGPSAAAGMGGAFGGSGTRPGAPNSTTGPGGTTNGFGGTAGTSTTPGSTNSSSGTSSTGSTSTGSTGSSSSGSSSSGSSSSSSSSRGGGMGGGGSTSNTALDALLKASTTKWSAAISGATSAADLELASGSSVIALGGWNGSDPSPTLAQFQAYVAAGQIHYYISGGGMGGGGGNGGTATESSQIATWVAAHYTATTVGSSTVYDLTQTATS